MIESEHSDRENLLETLDTLTRPHHLPTVLTAEGKTKTVYPTHEGLIKQLRNAIASSLGGAAGGKPARERIPLDADALIKYDQIEAAILERHTEYSNAVPALLPEDNLRAWYVLFMVTATEQAITNEFRTLAAWQRIIEEKLSPPTVRELAGEKCPECGLAWYDTVLNASVVDGRNPKHLDKGHEKDPDWYWVDEERKPTLTVTYRPDYTGGLTQSFAKCGNCNNVWMGAAGIRALAYTLENVIPEKATA